ncbi:hypothetical protein NQ318_002188 [Aromia moschata]|uniref:Uncharacterized protein n=1 Tax=Aromia moschata TaxID=1265417 RepID=A0AAV8Z2W5_9CUCU|nr:hypothetical protein NQ318_002188 [Aromia moschata]
MPSATRIILSRFFDSNVRLVADMCSRCYEECVDVRIVSVNLTFLRRTVKDSDFIGLDFLNSNATKTEARMIAAEYGFSKDDVTLSLRHMETLNEIIKREEETIATMEEKFITESTAKKESDERMFRGFSLDELDISINEQKKVVKTCEQIRYRICKRANLRVLRNIYRTRGKRKGRRKSSESGDHQSRSKYFCLSFNNNAVNIAPIKEENAKFEEAEVEGKCKHLKVEKDLCPENYEEKINIEELEYIDHESEYFKYIEEQKFTKAETNIKRENEYLRKEGFEDVEKIHLFVPPRSPHNLIEECLYHDPWALLVATMFFKSDGLHVRQALRVLVPEEEPRPAEGSGSVWRMSHDFVYKNWTNVKELYGIGNYGENAFRMFCLGDFSVEPRDRFLKIYKAWYQKIALKEGSG